MNSCSVRAGGWILAALLATAPLCAVAGPTQVERLAVLDEGGTTRVVIGLSGSAAVDIFALENPYRLVVDLQESALKADLRTDLDEAGVIRRIRHGVQPDRRLRVVFDLAHPVEVVSHLGRAVGHERRGGHDRYDLTMDFVPALRRPVAEIASVGEALERGIRSDEAIDGAGRATPPVLAQAEAGVVGRGGAADAAGRTEGFRFGSSMGGGPANPAPAAELASPWRIRLDRGLLEGGFLGASGRPADTSVQLQAVVSATRALGERGELRLGARLDGHHLRGQGSKASDLDASYDETWLRWRGDDWRFTAGAQKVIWGRTDEISPTDRMSRKDLTRFGLDEMADRRRASPALRLEWFHGDWTTDLLWTPVFRGAVLPDRDRLWHPVDRRNGRLLGLPDNPALAELVREGGFREHAGGSGGVGIRFSRAGRGLDHAVTVQRVRHSQPYYRMDEAARRALLATGDPAQALAAAPGALFESQHPRTWVVGGDLGLAAGAWTWRFEAAWLSDVPVTRTDFSLDTVRGFDWVAGVEAFPGDRDFRVTVQLAGMHLLGTSDVLDRRSAYFVNGELESPFDQNRWRGRLRFSYGLDRRDVYLNPELAWIAWEPQELYVGMHWLNGADATIGEFYRDRRLFVLGWRGQF